MMFSWTDYVRAVATTEQIPTRYRKLRVVQLAQAIVESARGTSKLFQEAGNPGGLKWRDKIDDNYTEKITHQIWLVTPSEPNGCYWCHWKTAEKAAMGYWRFIGRPNSPYQGWEEYDNDPEGYLQYIWEKGYATDPNYVSKVKNVFPEAQSLLDEYGGEQPPPSRIFKVAIMPGHGGTDSGAVNHTLNLREKDYNWKEAVEIKARLEAEGNYQVIICRSENELASLSTLQQRANDSGANVCLCLHHNACNRQAKGWWLFYVNRSPEFEKFIKIIDKHFRGLPLQGRGYEYAGTPFAHDWYSRVWNCTHACTMPTILFESCFIDNDEDARWLRDGGYQQIVEKICAGVKEYLGSQPPLPQPEKFVFVCDANPPLNVRKGAGSNYDPVGRLDNGTRLTVVGEEGNWLKISKPIEGYVHRDLTKSSYCVFVNDPNPPLKVRSGAGTNFSVVTELTNGTPLNVIGTDDNWLRIDKPVEGYVFTSLTSSLHRVFAADANPPLNVRSGPGTTYEKVGQLDNNTALTVVDAGLDSQGARWLRISSPCSGWVLESLTSDRLMGSGINPPASNLSESEQYDYCAEIITHNGGTLRKRNLISFRKETSTKVNDWHGCYDDITYMIWKDGAGKHARKYASNTEPSSQYEDSNNPLADRNRMGVDANGDGRLDLGRLPEGYYEYKTGTSATLGKVLCPTASAMAERDTSHDGLFQPNEPRASAGTTMLFHQGGETNPFSAGCQTMPPNEYTRFWADLNSNGDPGVIGYTIVRWCSIA